MQASLGQELAVFVVGAFPAAGEDQHVQIAQQDRHGFGRVVGNQPFDDQHPAVAGHGPAAGTQDPDRIGVIPVVQHVGQDVGVRTVRDALEEVSRHDLAAIGHARRL